MNASHFAQSYKIAFDLASHPKTLLKWHHDMSYYSKLRNTLITKMASHYALLFKMASHCGLIIKMASYYSLIIKMASNYALLFKIASHYAL